MTFSIDNHTFDVIELDGTEHDPVPVQNADVYAGKVIQLSAWLLLTSLVAQRISIVLNANQTVDNYWIRAPCVCRQ